jgi:serine O-acetyltransferase
VPADGWKNDPNPASALSFTELVFSDFKRHRKGEENPTWLKIIPRLFSLTGMIATIILRAQQCLMRSGHVKSAWLLRTIGIFVVSADFVPPMSVGTGLYLPHPVGVTIGGGLVVGNNVMIAGGVTAGVRGINELVDVATIADDAKIWAHAVLVGGVHIGEGAEVAANSVVTKDVEPYTIVGGIPARKIADVQAAPALQG